MRDKFLTRNVFVSMAVATMGLNALPVDAAEHHGVSHQIKVHAPIKVTYDALRNLRAAEPDGTKVISSNETETIVEETFEKLPVIGQAVCVYKETYQSPHKVSYKMIRSDKLKAFEGEWTLTEVDDGKATMVKLNSFVDTGLKVPFAKQITQMASSGEVKEHVETLKKYAEQQDKKLATGSAHRPL